MDGLDGRPLSDHIRLDCLDVGVGDLLDMSDEYPGIGPLLVLSIKRIPYDTRRFMHAMDSRGHMHDFSMSMWHGRVIAMLREAQDGV